MNAFLFFCLALAVLSLIIVLALGIFSMAKGGEFNSRYGNKLMQARLILQAAAIALLALAYYASH